jgi:decaprenylphospho-beta-D-ribofuranose 2-oxidase
MSAQEDGYCFRPTHPEQVREIFEIARTTGRKVVLRGAGRSYGDAAILGEALILDISRMNRILSYDPQTGVVQAEAGVTIGDLWRLGIEDGWWPPVVSGTAYPTLGGALGMNIHGKNAYRVGTLGEQVLSFTAITPSGSFLTLTPDNPDFYRIISTAGLLAVIVQVSLQLKKVQTGDLDVLALAPRTWQEQFDMFRRYEPEADYMVSWVDCFGKGSQAGRGVFHAAWYQHGITGAGHTLSLTHQDLPDTLLGFFPKSIVWRFLKPLNNRIGMKVLNRAKDFAASTLGNGKHHPQSLVGFSFLLDYVPNWRNAYLPGGFVQYQSFVPKEYAQAVFARQIDLQQAAKCESFLGVLKRHRPDRFLFSHGIDGYSLALDFKLTSKNRERLFELAHQMNELVLQAGGKFYLAKDSTLRERDFMQSVGTAAIAEYRQAKEHFDPEGLLSSRQAIRLGLSRSSDLGMF